MGPLQISKRAARLRAVLTWFMGHVIGLEALRKLLPADRGKSVGLAPRRAPPNAAEPSEAVAPAPAAARPARDAGPPVASHAAAGAALFGCLLFLAGALPGLLPAVFLAFAATALPWRVFHYARVVPKNQMYLLDFCYAVSAAATAFLLAPEAWRRSAALEGAVYALADGPVAAALVAWQCAWVFHSPEHTVSVLLHLLPGLAMAAHHHLPCQSHASLCFPRHQPATALAGTKATSLYLLAAPLAFYLAWQALYFVAVQLLGRRYIRANNLDTSYRCLTRRARRAGNVWARLVLRGGTARRLVMYGLLQLAFTVGTLLLFIPTYHSRRLAFAWQAVKFLVPVFYGCKYQCDRLYKAAMAEGVRRHLLQVDSAGNLAAIKE